MRGLQARVDARPALVCSCSKCSANVVYVSGYAHARGTPRERWVDPYIRLAPGTEHSGECESTPAGAIKQLVADARAIDDLYDLFDEGGGTVIFRLGAVRRALLESERPELREPDDDASGGEATAYKQRKRVANYLRSAIGVARLHALVERESKRALEQQLEIWTAHGRIAWGDFFYARDRLPELYRRLTKLGGSFTHPVAIEFTHRKWIDGDQDHSLQGVGVRDGDSLTIVPWLRLQGRWSERKFANGKTYIALIQPRARRNGEWRNINADVYHRSQIAPLIDSVVEA